VLPNIRLQPSARGVILTRAAAEAADVSRTGGPQMGYKAIRLIGFVSIVICMVLLVTGALSALGSAPTSGPLWLAFMFLGVLGTSVGFTLESQAAQIAALQRQLAEQQAARP
jgi:hypothetical protein